MTSKEYIEGVLYNMEDLLKQAKTDNCKSVIIDCEDEIMHYNQIIKDLEELEELKKIMGTPIQDIMKRLKILEIIKKWSFLDTFYREDTDTTYDRFLCNIHTKGMKEDFEKVKEWLDGKD